MNGNNESNDSLKKVEDKIAEFEKRNGFGEFNYTGEDIVEVCNDIMGNMNSWDSEECYHSAVKLDYYSIFLQKLVNQDYARVNFLSSEISRMTSNKLSQYVGSFSQKEFAAITNDDYISLLDKHRMYYKVRLDRLSYLVPRLDSLKYSVTNLGKYKEKQDVNK